jgi:hypothetical protein
VLLADLEDLIGMMRAAGCQKDLIEVEMLKAVVEEVDG